MADETPDALEVAVAEVAEVTRRLEERREKLGQIQARRAEVEGKIRDGALAGEVTSLGALSAERATLGDAEAALVDHGIPNLEKALSDAKAREAEIRRERKAERDVAHRNELQKAVDVRAAAVSAGVIALGEAINAWGTTAAELGYPVSTQPALSLTAAGAIPSLRRALELAHYQFVAAERDERNRAQTAALERHRGEVPAGSKVVGGGVPLLRRVPNW